MTALTANTPRKRETGTRGEYPVIASEIIYEGAAVGLVDATGHARPVTVGDTFVGFAEAQADNSAGAAADINVRTIKKGTVVLAVSGAVITDVDQPVYATDDNTFVFLPTGGVFIGFVNRFVSSGIVTVDFNVDGYKCPYAAMGGVFETVSGNLTLDIEDTGKVLFVDTDATTTTLPAIATPMTVTLVNIGAFGAVAINVSPNSNDLIHATNLAGTLDKDHINTKATARRGDLVTIQSPSDADGWGILNQVGTWAQEA